MLRLRQVGAPRVEGEVEGWWTSQDLLGSTPSLYAAGLGDAGQAQGTIGHVSWADDVRQRGVSGPWGIYLHVPFCSTRCGYCDFNTYTADELGPGASRSTYARTLVTEIACARQLLPDAPPLSTVFVGGGTPTLIGAADLVEILDEVRMSFGLEADAEVTVEANPDSVDARSLALLRDGGYSRVSFGVQSLAPHVLGVLDRTHTPGRALTALREAREAGFDHVSADLIYATPDESDDDLRRSVESVLSEGIDHLSAYSLIVEPGTRLAARIGRGEVPMPDDDVAAERYLLIDELAQSNGLQWYEVSNWSRPGGECRHNLGYWRGLDWWGAGPGAHGHLSGLRWWNVKHPASYAARLAAGEPAVESSEELTPADRRVEEVMLGLRLREGMASAGLDPDVMADLSDNGLVAVGDGRIRLTDAGRLLADGIVRRLTA